MLFNRAGFNRAAYFNRQDVSSTLNLYGQAAFTYAFNSATGLRSNVPLANSRAVLAFDAGGKLLSNVPFSGVAGITFTPQGAVTVRLAFAGSSGIAYAVNGELKTDESKGLTLTGLNLQPGESVVIDTDRLEIFVRGVEDVSSWQSGGDWVKLLAGLNFLTFLFDGEENEITVRVDWQDRWF